MLTIIRGLPGSGKSTLAGKLQAIGDVDVFYEADQFFMIDGEYRFDRTKLGQAHAWCQERTRRALETGKNVAVANTFTTSGEVRAYYEMATRLGVGIRWMECDGEYGSIHNVPPEAMARMRGRWQELNQVLRELKTSPPKGLQTRQNGP